MRWNLGFSYLAAARLALRKQLHSAVNPPKLRLVAPKITQPPTLLPLKTLHKHYPFLTNSKEPASDNYKALIAVFAVVSYFGALFYFNIKKEVRLEIDIDVLKKNFPNAFVANLSEFTLVSDLPVGGHSDAKKFKRMAPNGEEEFWYFKTTFSKEKWTHEIVCGAFARWMLGEEFPIVSAVKIDTGPHQNTWGVASKSMAKGTHVPCDLEEWASSYFYDNENYNVRPRKLATSIAMSSFLGDGDNKLANLVTDGSRKRSAYLIDLERAFEVDSFFTLDPEQLLKRIIEFSPVTAQERISTMESGSDTHDNPYQPLRGEPEILAAIKPILLEAINENLAQVKDLYEKIAKTTDEELHQFLDGFGPLLNKEDHARLFGEFTTRREQCQQFLNGLENQNRTRMRA